MSKEQTETEKLSPFPPGSLISAPGKLERDVDSTTKFKAVFIVGDARYVFSASTKHSIDSKYASSSATLHYYNIADLNGTRAFEGKIGTDTFKIMFENNVFIDGTLLLPDLTPMTSVVGQGDWSWNMLQWES